MKEGLVITFEQLPIAVSQLLTELADIKNLLTQNRTNTGEIDKPLTIQDAAALLNVAVPTIYAWIGAKSIPHYKKGRRVYFSRADLSEWVKSGRKKTVSEIAAEANQYLAKSKKG